jgi:murein L,D-transpeptidase YafK
MWFPPEWIKKRLRPLAEARPLIKAGLAAFVLSVVGLVTWSLWPPPHSRVALPAAATADLVVVHKAARRLELYRKGVLLKGYTVSLGSHPIGPKWEEGDGRTPEGEYIIDYRKGDSSFHRALHISYPGSKDLAIAHSHGVSPGGLVMIHGTKNGRSPQKEAQLPHDWTDGCIAVTDQEIDEIWRAVPDGTRIVLQP